MKSRELAAPQTHTIHTPRRAARPVVVLAVVTAMGLVHAAEIAVPNGSFESQIAGPPFGVNNSIDSWQKTPKPDWFVESETSKWDQASGVFANTPVADPRHIDNMTGNQALYLFALPTVGLFQDYGTMDFDDVAPSHAFDVTFEAGMAYDLTVGVIGGGGGMPEGAQLMLGLYYLGPGNVPVTVGSSVVTHSLALFPTTTHFVDQALSIPVVAPGDAWAGQKLGMQIMAISGDGTGYWDLDNVRLTATAVPEPGVGALLVTGLVGWLGLRRRVRTA
jgi:hypothetical protein